MSKFRPIGRDKKNIHNKSIGCIYVISDIHGLYRSLRLILDRILPLRSEDKLIFLGDYIDRSDRVYEVIETLISLRKKYSKDQVIFLRGNHEQLLLDSLGLGINGTTFSLETITPYAMWITNGGAETIQSYSRNKGVEIKNPKDLSSSRCLSFIDKDHIKFLQEETQLYYELNVEGYLYQFAHAAVDPTLPIDKQDPDVLMWDRSLYATVKLLRSQNKTLPWAKEKTIITGHNYETIYFTPGFIMLDSSSQDFLPCLELNSMQCMIAPVKNTDRLVKYNIKES